MPSSHRFHAAAGFTLLETMFVLLILGTTLATAMLLSPGAVSLARANGSQEQLVAALRFAREQSLSQRRDIIISFIGTNQVQVAREEFPGPAVTPLTLVTLENGMQFLQFQGVPDTPDAFGAGAAVDFGTANSFEFTSDGTFVDENDDVLNGTVFLGVPNQPLTARAVTLFGPTALIRSWRWDGRRWVE